MMYLTEDAEGNDDCVSVVSDALSDDQDYPDDISELSRALEALEGEALAGSSPGAPSGEASGALEDQLAERLGISPDADPSAFAQQMAKLYNNLGLKMMERRKHEEALGLLRKAEAVVENSSMWPGGAAVQKKRARMQAITCNNLGCLFKRRNMPQLALQHLQKALALEEAMGGSVQNRSSTHLNICAAFSALKRPKEALGHAERAIILLQRALWAHQLNFQDGLNMLVRQLAVPGAARALLGSANVLAMAYHNAAVEHEKLGRLREALVSFTRAYLVSSKCLGHKAPMTVNLSKALKAFQQRQARYLPTGAAHAARKAPSLATRGSAAAAQPKRTALTHSRPSKTAGAAKSGGSSSNLSKATLPLDKGRTTAGAGMGSRAPSASRLATVLQQQQQPGL
jgi:tetratricopeptide (TPR) repeat protein